MIAAIAIQVAPRIIVAQRSLRPELFASGFKLLIHFRAGFLAQREMLGLSTSPEEAEAMIPLPPISAV
jgi:hypothetical protein